MTHADPAAALIARFGLAPHPEGGWYRRLYCSTKQVSAPHGMRPAATSIVYLLRANEVSRWHCVRSDEIWHFYEGSPLTLLQADPDLVSINEMRLGPAASAPPHGSGAGEPLAGSAQLRRVLPGWLHGGARFRLRRLHIARR